MPVNLNIMRDGPFLIVRFDQPNRPVNTFTGAMMDELAELIGGLEAARDAVTGVIFASGKSEAFIAGVDLFELREMPGPSIDRFVARGQSVLDRLAHLPMSTVAAINGSCLGGGLELALACRYRVVADVGQIDLGLPEARLGILPAWGGTVRLTRLMGPRRALPLLLTGRTLAPRQALGLGIVDEVVKPEALLDAARRILRQRPRPRSRPWVGRLIGALPPWRGLVFSMARRQALAKTWGNYPNASRIIEVAQTAAQRGAAAGFAAERAALADLAGLEATHNLMRLFFLRHDAKHAAQRALEAHPTPVNQAAVIGGGIMGAGITHALVRAGIPVRLVEADSAAASAALRRVRALLDDDVRHRRLSPRESGHAMNRVSPATDFSGVRLADVAIEAVAENADIKRQVFAMLGQATRRNAVLATNTSSLCVADMAQASGAPERVIGLHFFNPVPLMPLVEVVRAPASSDLAVAVGAELALRLGKAPILVGDGPGFVVNRVLAPYLVEAMLLAGEGADVAVVDQAMRKWGLAVGPFELLDQIGLDVARSVLATLRERLGWSVTGLPDLGAAVGSGWLGRKSGLGFYDYRGKPWARRTRPNRRWRTLWPRAGGTVPGAGPVDEAALQWRLVLPMVNEAAKLMQEGVTESPEAIDLATVLGLGFAPFRGGLTQFARTVGLDQIRRRLEELAEHHGPRFTPAEAIPLLALTPQPGPAPAGTSPPAAAPAALPSSSPERGRV
jgi:3-hydroxyacyl-CoA dehydrogenase/enoyl-CoA hydratase/3-hydroxybutyryl-CoA epimerase